jgi:hypothetical protein
MKLREFSTIILIAGFTAISAGASIASASEQTPPPRKRHARVIYVERDHPYDCRTGWWQTWRYGHEWPRWGTWCRR